MVDVLRGDRTLVMFAEDIKRRGEEVCRSSIRYPTLVQIPYCTTRLR